MGKALRKGRELGDRKHRGAPVETLVDDLEDGDDAIWIKPLKDGDRTVWRAAMRLNGGPIELVVDQVTGLVTWYSDGGSTFTAEVDWASPRPANTASSSRQPDPAGR